MTVMDVLFKLKKAKRMEWPKSPAQLTEARRQAMLALHISETKQAIREYRERHGKPDAFTAEGRLVLDAERTIVGYEHASNPSCKCTVDPEACPVKTDIEREWQEEVEENW